jgi:phosphate transport system permease protein
MAALSTSRSATGRKLVNSLFIGGCIVATGIALLFLVALLTSLVVKGIGGVNLAVFTQNTPAPGSPGGLANAIVGSLLMCATAMVLAVVVGVLAGTWLAEYARESAYGKVVRFTNDVLLSAPSILVGLFVYQLAVKPLHGFSGFAGALALGLLAAPVVARTTEDVLRLQSRQLRESGSAIGAPIWITIRRILWRAAAGGMITGALLAFARISGETAPLLFTSLNNQLFSLDMTKPMANLPTVIFNYALSAYDDWRRLAWVGSLLIAVAVLGANIIVRVLSAEKKRPS